jgi:hypothetical protein
MKKRRVICVALLGLAGAVAGVVLMLYGYARADVLGGPLPAPRLPRDIIQLTPVEELGKLILYDRAKVLLAAKTYANDLLKSALSVGFCVFEGRSSVFGKSGSVIETAECVINVLPEIGADRAI